MLDFMLAYIWCDFKNYLYSVYLVYLIEFSSSSACFIGGKVELINSPQKRILFQTRYQGGEQEIIIGVIKNE